MRFYNETEIINSIDRKINKLKTTFNLTFKRNDLDRLLTRGSITQKFYKDVNKMWDIVNEVYPNRAEIHITPSAKYEYHTNTYGSNHINLDDNYRSGVFKIASKIIFQSGSIVIHFPEFTIKNTNNQSTIIRDLFVRIKFSIHADRSDKEIIEFSGLSGTRTTITNREYLAGYGHSHLHGIDYTRSVNRCVFTDFCTGSGQEIDSIESMITNESKLDEDLFRLYLFQIENYLGWESLEGGPYVPMSRLTDRKNYGVSICTTTDKLNFYNAILTQVGVKRLNLSLNWKFESGQYKIIEDDRFEDLFRYFYEEDRLGLNTYFYYIDETGAYYRPKSNTVIRFNHSEDKYVIFKNQKHFLKMIEMDDDNPIVNTTRYVNPNIKSYVKTRLEYTANLLKVRNLGVKKFNSYANSR